MAMSEQDFLEPEEDNDSSDDAYDYAREPEPDAYTLRSNERRSRYFLAAMSFLLALLCLSAYLNHIPSLNDTLLQIGVVVFAASGIFFLLRGRTIDRASTGPTLERDQGYAQKNVEPVEGDWLYERGYRDGGHEEAFTRDDGAEVEGDDGHKRGMTPFEVLVQEALATIPPEFQERMENVFVRVEYEPGEEVLRRVGTKEGYTLLGLYEGVPLTVYGRQHSSLPETITIYQRTIERYCHGDPDRIRRQVRQTVLHEVAHHFGIDHEEMPIWIR